MAVKFCRTVRTEKGSYIIDVPVTLWVLFVLLIFPFLDFTTIVLRTYFFRTVANQAVHAAIRCQTFRNDITDTTPNELSAYNAAQAAAKQTADTYTGVHVNYPIAVEPVQTLISDPTESTVISPPITQLPDTDKYVISIRVTLTGSIDPLVRFSLTDWIGHVPGLTDPIEMTTVAEGRYENVQGLRY